MNAITAHLAALEVYLNSGGSLILDIGCGTAEISKSMLECGASVIGLECSSVQMEKALTGNKFNLSFIYGVGQALPFRNDSFEAVVFFNSLHHIPEEEMSGALAEASRVVKFGGLVYVAEPLVKGSCFKLDAMVKDETDVRAKAFEVLQNASQIIKDLMFVGESYYDVPFCYQDFEEYKDELLRFDCSRREIFKKIESEIRKIFDELGTNDFKGMNFIQPMRSHCYRVRSKHR